MIFQLNPAEEIQFLLYITIFIIGIQLAIYLLYRFLKIKIERLPLNKSIVLFGSLLIIIGDLLSLISILYILDSIETFNLSGYLYYLSFISIILLIFGLIFTLIGLYVFPSFYGFKWEGNILKFFIINQNNNFCLYSHDFSQIESEVKSKDYEKLFSVGIIGIDSILSAITNTRGEKINKIKQADSLILLEYGSGNLSQIIYALVVKKDLKSNKNFLKAIKKQFESFYRELLSKLDTLKGSEEQIFGSFDIIIEDLIH
ncbi:MAG: hypothetical protein EU532_01265 [Promethearchaeota archaeon]|nr:MAG: hypothetical protein EU532_01265 [Candidatus Lokiarchaeota archaeon]